MGSVLLVEWTQLIAIYYLELQQRHEQVYNIPDRQTLIKYRIYPYRHIFVYLYSGCTVTASEKDNMEEREEIRCSHE
jgi:hypothetical protein